MRLTKLTRPLARAMIPFSFVSSFKLLIREERWLYKRREETLIGKAPGDKRRQVASSGCVRREETMRVIAPGDKRRRI